MAKLLIFSLGSVFLVRTLSLSDAVVNGKGQVSSEIDVAVRTAQILHIEKHAVTLDAEASMGEEAAGYVAGRAEGPFHIGSVLQVSSDDTFGGLTGEDLRNLMRGVPADGSEGTDSAVENPASVSSVPASRMLFSGRYEEGANSCVRFLSSNTSEPDADNIDTGDCESILHSPGLGDMWYLENEHLKTASGLCLDEHHPKTNNAYINNCTGKPSQSWFFDQGQIKSRVTHKCLSNSAGDGNLKTETCQTVDSDAMQLWHFKGQSLEAHRLHSNASTLALPPTMLCDPHCKCQPNYFVVYASKNHFTGDACPSFSRNGFSGSVQTSDFEGMGFLLNQRRGMSPSNLDVCGGDADSECRYVPDKCSFDDVINPDIRASSSQLCCSALWHSCMYECTGTEEFRCDVSLGDIGGMDPCLGRSKTCHLVDASTLKEYWTAGPPKT